MDIKDSLLFTSPVISGILGAWITYFFGLKSRKGESILKFKEEKYANLIIHLQGFVWNTVSAESKKRFFEENYKSWLYASDDVVNSINELIESIVAGRKPNPNEGRRLIWKLILEMRKDLLGKTNLKELDFRFIDVINHSNRK